jgi:predicted ATPase
MPDLLLERADELAAIDRAIRLARAGCARTLFISGPPGSGRTTVLERARARARTQGLTVLTAGGEESERNFPFALARRLLEPHAEWTAGFETLLELNRLLGAHAPVLIAVDDLQWCDAESLDWLAFAARRLRRTGSG